MGQRLALNQHLAKLIRALISNPALLHNQDGPAPCISLDPQQVPPLHHEKLRCGSSRDATVPCIHPVHMQAPAPPFCPP
eukprot:2791224-Rhodomonas_salina.1